MNGLTSAEAQKRLLEFGPNELQKPQGFSSFKILVNQFKSPLIYILLLAGAVTFLVGELTDSLVIWLAVLLNTILGFYQERKAQKALIALRSLLHPQTKVIRDGQQKTIDARLLVPEDLVILAIGDRVPADGKLVEATDLTLNEAILTGESAPVVKKIKASVFAGTTVVTGIGKMQVVQTGSKTEIGKIGRAVAKVLEEETPLQAQLKGLAKVLAWVVGLITLVIFILGKWRGYEVLEMFLTSVAVAVAAIPEGLVVALTVILALGMQQILRQKALVRKLLAAETLGSVSIICVDKTGTLTEGKLRVVKSDFTDEKLGVEAAILCNDLRDPLETAMMEWGEESIKYKVSSIKEKYPRIDEIPFSPKTKVIATLHPGILFVSGAPEVVLYKCKMQSAKCKIWEKKFDEYGSKGYRLVGFAYKRITNSELRIANSDLEDLQWLGILMYEDPVRVSVKEALQECWKAGIKVKVITGDYPSTAIAVLKKLNIRMGKVGVEIASRKLANIVQDGVITGEELQAMKLGDLDKVIDDIVLFARTNPEQKLKIVQALKDKGGVVAMMGDGVNDAPALARADIGIVVGEASDVARETADIVLLDSNFATILHAIEEGRAIFENIKKVVLYLLSDSFTEVILIGGAILLGLPLPVTAVQILWVNMVEDSLPAIALAFEPKEKGLMRQPPRARNAPILDLELKVLIFIIGLFTNLILFALFLWLKTGFLHLRFINTVIFVALGINSLFYVFACRSLRLSIFKYNPFANRFLNLAVILGFLSLVLAVYWPPLQELLKTQPLGLAEWGFLFSLGIFNLLAIEATKWLFIIRAKIT